tara:strand:- start:313 stop:504 length:192 start_codon:yes stop_codon:yes gene_type:complete
MNTTTGLTEEELMDLESFVTYVVTCDEDMPVIDYEMCVDYLESQDIEINDAVIDQIETIVYGG